MSVGCFFLGAVVGSALWALGTWIALRFGKEPTAPAEPLPPPAPPKANGRTMWGANPPAPSTEAMARRRQRRKEMQ